MCWSQFEWDHALRKRAVPSVNRAMQCRSVSPGAIPKYPFCEREWGDFHKARFGSAIHIMWWVLFRKTPHLCIECRKHTQEKKRRKRDVKHPLAKEFHSCMMVEALHPVAIMRQYMTYFRGCPRIWETSLSLCFRASPHTPSSRLPLLRMISSRAWSNVKVFNAVSFTSHTMCPSFSPAEAATLPGKTYLIRGSRTHGESLGGKYMGHFSKEETFCGIICILAVINSFGVRFCTYRLGGSNRRKIEYLVVSG